MEINIHETKIELIQWLTTLEDTSIIQKILELRTNERGDWWDGISRAEKESVEHGLLDAEEGNLNSNTEAKKIYGKWL